ncbi:MAG: hypothetical protein K0V04_17675, partial [Deltaproteobacteria bacterium]|nr:hypothetical protein [Deltaproteobacteria bacterium]
MHNPGPFAYFVFILWIPISAIMFAQNKPRRAAFLVLIGGTMVLPELVAFDLPILPAIDKMSMVGACAFVGLFFTAKSRWQRMRLLRGMQLFFFIFVIGNIGTSMTNPESFMFGGKLAWPGGPRFPIVSIPPLAKTEFIAMTISDFFDLFMPFAVGQMLVQDRDDLIVFLKSYAMATVIYAVPMLWEVVMSPQLHRYAYGYHALSFSHNVRGDGFKPTVLLNSGLGLAMFQFVGMTAAIALRRTKHKVGQSLTGGTATLILLFALSLSRNVGVMLYSGVAIPLLLAARPRMQTRVAFVLILLFITFPITRAKEWFPVDDIIAYVEKRSPERASSLGFRFENEDILLEHTAEKPTFGWGSFGRNRRYDEESGKDISVTDGEWAIHYSVRGAFGAVGWFWLIALPVLWGTWFIRRVPEREDQILLAAV